MASSKFTQITGQQLKKSLARRFIPLGDRLRDLLTKFGLRTQTVTLVKVQWSGGERGVGVPTVLLEEQILPNPKVSDFSAINAGIESIGVIDEGQVVVSEISGRYTEEHLRGLSADGSPTPDDIEFFWEIEFPKPDGEPGERRRFTVASAPSYDPGRLQWTVRLEKSNANRSRDGAP